MTILNSVLPNHILNAKLAKDVWGLLRVHYQGNDNIWQHYLLECLFTTTFCNLDSIEPQIAEVMLISHQLTDIGFSIIDQLLASMIRIKLPEL